jgi:outer membrane protein OmpA-like peptidoglycan-associated protein
MNNSSQSGKTVTASDRPLVLHFEMGSADLSASASSSLHSGIKSRGITPDTPLVISGYSCELGASRLNLMLSLQRALTVAHHLINRGYTVPVIQAKGEDDPVTTNLLQFYRNRRVEITTQP